MKNMINVIERATGNKFRAEEIEGGFQLYTMDGEKYKKLRESTFKRNYKVVKEEEQQAAPKAEPITAEKREKMLEKIKKMMALAENNPSEEEAMAAALQAHKLMAKYNIGEDELSLEEAREDITSIFTEQKHNSHLMAWRKPLAATVAKAFRCKCYISGQDVVFRGFKADAQLALNVYLMLYTVGDKLGGAAYGEQMERTGSGKGAYNSVALGFLAGVQDGFNAQCTTLMVVTPKAVEEDWSEFSKGFAKGRKNSFKVLDGDLYRRGYSEGKQAVKSRAIEGKEN